ncbi:tellurite resistance TerB family protein [Pseudaminobacter sp. 19-2017]|uniref:Tellurite resistance TerB family protein n=1 Tax=Pseudaminobacter soli (ex Zhang et al. 2022) TaxID=2831468 RepID=A0A942I3I7_9HYPH|nr:tellurite resistance TerB family protein [Pseudaminobacter soli]MBS3650388.1 tellurite resistance TerB family protein [Pseudaminobacter soli]
MFDPKKLLDDLLGTKVPGTQDTIRDKADRAIQMAQDNPGVTAAITAVLMGTRQGRQLTGRAAQLGGLAAIAGLAYQAYKNFESGSAPEAAKTETEVLPPPADSGFHPSGAPQGEAEFALTLVRAMIAAAKADGRIDEEERRKIGDRLAPLGLDEDAEKFLLDEMAAPLDLGAIVAEAKTEEQKVELYTASRLTIDPDSRAERGYLDLLAGRLNLPDELVEHVEATVTAAKTTPAAQTGQGAEVAPAANPNVNPRW